MFRRNALSPLGVVLVTQAAPLHAQVLADSVWHVGLDIEVRMLATGVWLHTSYQTYPGGIRVPSNGLIIQNGDSLLIVDSAWGELLTQRMVDAIETRFERRISDVVITHSHYDRMAGTAVFQHRGARVVAHPMTRRLANEQGLPLPDTLSGVTEPGGTTRIGPVEVFYGGPGHSPDNMMVWIPGERVLFGGCAVRAASSGSLGNVTHADLMRWPETIRLAQQRYGSAQIVVPGHGDPGDVDLLAHTQALLVR